MVHGTEVYKTLFQTIGVKAVVSATTQLIIFGNMKINKEGYRIIFGSGVVFLLGWLLFYHLFVSYRNTFAFQLSTVVLVVFWLYIITFFREPKRVRINDPSLVFAPCDGRVVVIEKVMEDEYLHGEMLQISVFMSLTNIHMNWFPVGGAVEYFRYHPGRYLVAWLPKASKDNEHTTTVVRMQNGHSILFRQIAGFVARRIVSYMKPGDEATQNTPAGFIKFGSRVDILLPPEYEVLVGLGDAVTGTQMPLARVKV